MNLANCADFNLPVTNFDDCNPSVAYSEIERIFLGGPKAAAFANIQDANEWNTRLSESTIGVDTIRSIIVIGDAPAAANVVKELSNGRKKTIGKDFTVNFTVDDISDENYTFFQTLDGQPKVRLFGYETQGGKMFHFGNAGILVDYQSNFVLARGRDEIETEVGAITWRRSQRANRIASPIFDNGSTVTPTTFDSTLAFSASATPGPTAGVSGTASGTDAEQKLEFNAITPQVGTPASMEIKVGGVSEAVFDYTSDYIGSAFRYTDKAGTVHTGNFVNGTVNF